MFSFGLKVINDVGLFFRLRFLRDIARDRGEGISVRFVPDFGEKNFSPLKIG